MYKLDLKSIEDSSLNAWVKDCNGSINKTKKKQRPQSAAFEIFYTTKELMLYFKSSGLGNTIAPDAQNIHSISETGNVEL